MAKLQRRKRKLGECLTRKQSIRNFCLECVGYEISEVHKCTALDCWLHPYRPGATKAELAAEVERAKEIEKVKKNAKEKQDDNLRKQ